MRSAEALSATQHEVRTTLSEPPEIFPRRKLRGGIDHHRQAVSVADIDDRIQRRGARGEMRTGEIEDRDRSVGDRGLDFPWEVWNRLPTWIIRAPASWIAMSYGLRCPARDTASRRSVDCGSRMYRPAATRSLPVMHASAARKRPGRAARHVSRIVAGQLGDTGRDRDL